MIMVHDVPFEPVCKTCQYDNIEIKENRFKCKVFIHRRTIGQSQLKEFLVIIKKNSCVLNKILTNNAKTK